MSSRQASAKTATATREAARAESPQRRAANEQSDEHARDVQQFLGNQGMLRRLESATSRRELHINAPGDRYEREADAVAEQVMRAPEASGRTAVAISSAPFAVRRKCACGGTCSSCRQDAEKGDEEHGHVQRKSDGPAASSPATAPPIVHQALRSPGQPLDRDTRSFLEPRFGRDLSHVRVHADTTAQRSARAIHARAYTVGNDIVFAAGQFAPRSRDSIKLLAHELTHVVQQTAGGAFGIQRQPASNFEFYSREDLTRKSIAGTMREDIIALQARSDVEKGWGIKEMQRCVLHCQFSSTEERRLYAQHFLTYLSRFYHGEEINPELLRSQMADVERLFQGSRSSAEVASVSKTAGSTTWVDEAAKTQTQKQKEQDAQKQKAQDYVDFLEQNKAIDQISAGIGADWTRVTFMTRGIGRKRSQGYYAGAAKDLLDEGQKLLDNIGKRSGAAIQAASAKNTRLMRQHIEVLRNYVAAFRANAKKLTQLSDEYEQMEQRWATEPEDPRVGGKKYDDRLYDARQAACGGNAGYGCNVRDQPAERVWQNGHFDPSEKDRVFADQNDMNSAAVQRRHDETRHQEVQAEIAQEDRFIAEMEAAKHQEMFMQPFGAEGAFIGLYNAAQLGMAGVQLVNSCREGVGECVQAAAPLVVAGALTHQAMKSGAVVDPGTPAPAGAATADVLGSQDRAYWTDTQAVSDNPATRFQQDKLGVTNLQDYNLEEIKDGGGGAEKPAGPLIVDVQSGPMIDQAGRRGFLTHIVSKTPGARGIAIEPGDYKLGYAGIIPTSKQDLNFARMLLQNMPEWPGPGETNWAEWQFDPNVPFPKTGDVTVLQGPAGAGRTPVPRTFFPPVSKIPGDVLPTNLKDVSGLDPTTLPELHGKVDQMYWRRGFGLSKADAPTVAALGKEVDQMLKPGGFIEVRVLPASDATRARQLAAAIPGSRVVEVPQSAIKAYAATPTRPSGLSDEQWSVLESAGPDIRNEYPTLGQGVFNRIIRIYKP